MQSISKYPLIRIIGLFTVGLIAAAVSFELLPEDEAKVYVIPTLVGHEIKKLVGMWTTTDGTVAFSSRTHSWTLSNRTTRTMGHIATITPSGGGGIMSLVAHGAQDVYLTNDDDALGPIVPGLDNYTNQHRKIG